MAAIHSSYDGGETAAAAADDDDDDDGVAQLVERWTRDTTEPSASAAQETFVRPFPSQKCCADSLYLRTKTTRNQFHLNM